MQMTSAIASLHQENPDLPSKNRVGGFEVVTYSCTRVIWPQALEPHQETYTTTTTTVSGVVEWLSKDPIGINGGLNQYVAFNNNPVMFRDPDGEWAHIVIGGLAGGIAGAIGGAVTGEGVWRGAIAGAAGGAVFAATFNPALGAATAAGLGTISAGVAAGVASGAASGLAAGIIKESFDAANPHDVFSASDVAASIGIGALTGGVLGPIGSMNAEAVQAGMLPISKSIIAEHLLTFDVMLMQELSPSFGPRRRDRCQ